MKKSFNFTPILNKKTILCFVVIILMFASPVIAESLGLDKTDASYTFLLWFIIPGLIYALSSKNPLLSSLTPRRHDRYQH